MAVRLEAACKVGFQASGGWSGAGESFASRDAGHRHKGVGVDMLVEILIGAAVMTLVTVLFTGPGMWSSSWGFKKREGQSPPPPGSSDDAGRQ